ncbi:MAG: hypothetical protein GY797_07855 [Deltaproteobacteria bacterium]|nr:hypothetical protein [Deltaproteobacteria bacterium]
MSTRLKLAHLAALLFTPRTEGSFPLMQALPSRTTRPSPFPLPPQIESGPIVIDASTAVPTNTATLSNYLQIGRTYHPLCRNAFMEKHIIGYYHYERRVQFHTCALAAVYVGAFGPQSIERPDFSLSMALWRLSQKVGYDLNNKLVYGPTGRYQSVAQEMMDLIDKDYWTREGVSEWLRSLGL